MLLRHSTEGIMGIPQPSHAWMAAQLARAWGNAEFERPEPFEDICLAALVHDAGWADLEIAPLFDVEKGRLLDFMEVPLARKLHDAAHAVVLTQTHSLYASVLVSMHFVSIYGKIARPEVEEFVAFQMKFQAAAGECLSRDVRYLAHVSADTLERARMLVGTVDRLSIALCVGVTDQTAAIAAPRSGNDVVMLQLAAHDGPFESVSLSPWPFSSSELVLQCEGRHMAGHDEASAVAAWHDVSKRAAIEVRLISAGSA